MKKMVKFYCNEGSPLESFKIQRNDKCPCGSGKKHKNCHNQPSMYKLTGKALEDKQKNERKNEDKSNSESIS